MLFEALFADVFSLALLDCGQVEALYTWKQAMLELSLLAVQPLTGRTHQIRVPCQQQLNYCF